MIRLNKKSALTKESRSQTLTNNSKRDGRLMPTVIFCVLLYVKVALWALLKPSWKGLEPCGAVVGRVHSATSVKPRR